MANHVWVIEVAIGDDWFPIIKSAYGISGVCFTRADARESKREIEKGRRHSKVCPKYRVQKYVSVN